MSSLSLSLNRTSPNFTLLKNGGIQLSAPEVCNDVKRTVTYDDELEKSRTYEKEKMDEQLNSKDEKKREKGKRKQAVLEQGELVEHMDAMTEDEWKEFMQKHYNKNTNFVEDMKEFKARESKFSEFPDSISEFTDNGAVPLESRIGFRAHDGSFWTYREVNTNGNDLHDVFGEKAKFRGVVVQAYEKRLKTQVFQLLHYHDEPAESWGYGNTFVSAPGGRGRTLNAALTELNEETHYQLQEQIKSLKITGYLDEPDKRIRHYFVEVTGAVPMSLKDRKVTPKFFESFSLQKNPKDPRDHVEYLVPRRGGYFDAVHVFKAQVLPSSKTITFREGTKWIHLFGRQFRRASYQRRRVFVDLRDSLKRLGVPIMPGTLLLRFNGATRQDIYSAMLQASTV